MVDILQQPHDRISSVPRINSDMHPSSYIPHLLAPPGLNVQDAYSPDSSTWDSTAPSSSALSSVLHTFPTLTAPRPSPTSSITSSTKSYRLPPLSIARPWSFYAKSSPSAGSDDSWSPWTGGFHASQKSALSEIVLPVQEGKEATKVNLIRAGSRGSLRGEEGTAAVFRTMHTNRASSNDEMWSSSYELAGECRESTEDVTLQAQAVGPNHRALRYAAVPTNSSLEVLSDLLGPGSSTNWSSSLGKTYDTYPARDASLRWVDDPPSHRDSTQMTAERDGTASTIESSSLWDAYVERLQPRPPPDEDWADHPGGQLPVRRLALALGLTLLLLGLTIAATASCE